MQASLKLVAQNPLVDRLLTALAALVWRIAMLRLQRPPVTGLKSLVKRIIVSLLPEALLQPLKRIHYVRLLRRVSIEDEPDLKLARYLARPGSAVLDIGANIGVYTKFSSQFVGAGGRVCSVEPIPVTCDVLRSNVKRLGLGNVSVINAAISDRDGSVTMEVPLYESGVENFYEARIVAGEGGESKLRRVTVDSRTVDSLFPELLEDVSFVKCDVEGHELKCIEGAGAVIDTAKPAWLIEIAGDTEDPDSDAARTFSLMEEKGYEAYWFDGTEIRKRYEGEKSTNYFFLTPQHLCVLEAAGVPGAHELVREQVRRLRRPHLVPVRAEEPAELVA